MKFIQKVDQMDIDQIEAFLAIAQVGGVTRAATRLRRSQPAVSRRLGQLEDELGAPLFERVRGGVRPTDVGHAVVPHAEAVMAAINSCREAARDQLGEGTGTVSLAVVGTLVDGRLTRRLREFASRFKKPPLKVMTTSSADVSQRVRCGDATLGLRYFVDRDPRLECQAIGEETMLVVAAGSALRRRQTPHGPWIGFPLSNASKESFGHLLRRQLLATGLNDEGIVEVDSLSAQKRLVEAGFGLAFLPHSSVADELRARTLKTLPLPGFATKIPVTMIHRRNGYLSPAAQALKRLLSESHVRQ